jgi:hypothetical protein
MIIKVQVIPLFFLILRNVILRRYKYQAAYGALKILTFIVTKKEKTAAEMAQRTKQNLFSLANKTLDAE